MTHTRFLTKWKISILISTLTEFTLLLILENTEDYEQDKDPKGQFTIFYLHVTRVASLICCILSHLWMLQQYVLSDTHSFTMTFLN